MPENDLSWFQQHYARMSETELLRLAHRFDDLPPLAQTALRAELANRKLNLDSPPSITEDEEKPAKTEPPPLVTVAAFRDLPEAFVARAVLEQAGIPCFLQNENVVRLDWALSNAIGGARLQVAEKDAEQAAAVLAEPIPESFTTTDGDVFEQPVCPRCGSLHVMADDLDRKIRLASTIGSGVLLPFGLTALALQEKGALKCEECGRRWADDSNPDHALAESQP